MDRSGQYTVGVDFGTLSGRAVVVRLSDGAEVGSAVHEYAHGVLDTRLAAGGMTLPPDWALQVPDDYLDVLANAVPAALRVAGVDPNHVVGLGTDFTACTVLPVLEDGTPLCNLVDLAERPHAYVKLWKHHAAQGQADRINELAHARGESWIGRYGGLISSEWQLAKGLQVLEEDPELYDRADLFVEAADWIVWQLTGHLVRNPCTAGYKGNYQDGRYPDRDFLAALNPAFAGFAEEKLAGDIGQLGDAAGGLTARAAALTGLPVGTPVAVGNVDAHVTAPAARATGPGQMVAIMGTSTCHVMSHDALVEVPGMCGVVDGGIVAGSWGYEAGQSGVGDIFGWFTRTSVPAAYADAAHAAGVSVHEHLTRLAAEQQVGEHGLVALDWHSGNRSVLVDHELSGAVVGLTLEHQARGRLPGAARGDRVRHPGDRGDVPRQRGAGGRVRGGRGARQERSADADLRRRDPAPALGHRLRAGSGARLRHPRGGGGRCLSRRTDGGQDPGQGPQGRLSPRRGARPGLRRALRAVPRPARPLRPCRHDHAPPQGHSPHGLRHPGADHVMSVATDVAETIGALRREVCALHAELVRYQLVVWTAGNVSARVPGQDLLVIKPSGVSYDDLTPGNMVVCDLSGRVVEGEHAPSSDTEAQAYVYREMPAVGGVVHTHSTYATAWAVRGEAVPCVLTMCADEFGGDIPVGPFAVIGDDSIGRGIVSTLRESRSPAVLMRNHGVFTIGPTARAAVAAAVMCEDVARTVHISRQLGPSIPVEQGNIDALYQRYQNVYGQTQEGQR